MTLLIQRAEHRDTQALQAKLDEFIRATGECAKRCCEHRRQGA
ncbi:low affinity iron permease family protein [Mesorhizobium silamurunense]|nr:low affinity iron permease family protein [Mesorhizobium silamurunense]